MGRLDCQARQASKFLLRNYLPGLFEVWKTVVSGFRECDYTEWENDYQKLRLILLDTILHQAVPKET